MWRTLGLIRVTISVFSRISIGMPRFATVNRAGATLPKPSSLPQGSTVHVPKNGPRTMTKGGRRRSTRRRRTTRRK